MKLALSSVYGIDRLLETLSIYRPLPPNVEALYRFCEDTEDGLDIDDSVTLDAFDLSWLMEKVGKNLRILLKQTSNVALRDSSMRPVVLENITASASFIGWIALAQVKKEPLTIYVD